MEKRKTNLGPLLIIIAACFWGSMGILLVLAAVVVLNVRGKA